MENFDFSDKLNV
jgi:2-oxoisovalerate dehydrogenase E1 component beta subunit